MGYMTRAQMQRETGRTRREVDELLAAGMPHETVGNGRGSEIRIDRGKAMKWLADRALDGKAAPAPAPTKPDFPPWVMAIVDGARTDVERGYALGVMSAVYETPRVVGGIAISIEAGLTMDQAFELSRGVTLGMAHVLFEAAAKIGVEPFASAGDDGPEIISPEGFVRLDWRQVARNAGEPDWRPPLRVPGWASYGGEDDDEAEGDGGPA